MSVSLHPATLMPFVGIPLAPLLAPVDPDLLEMEDFAEVTYDISIRVLHIFMRLWLTDGNFWDHFSEILTWKYSGQFLVAIF